MYHLSTRSLEHMEGVDSRMVEIAKLAITLTKIDFGIPSDGGYRTDEVQRRLFVKGVSQCDGKLKKSYHQTGMALDFFAYAKGKASWDLGDLAMVATAFFQAASALGYGKLEWGGLWGDPDGPHVQLV